MTEDPGQERKRPVGGAAAWRRAGERPTRAADDERREGERYGRAGLGERTRGALGELGSSLGAVAVLVLLVGGWLLLRFLTPSVVGLAELRAGDCLYIRAADPEGNPPIGTPSAVRDALVRGGAERASCALSHGHEVVAVVPLPAGGFQGQPGLMDAADPPCRAAFVQLTDPGLALTVVVPDMGAWNSGVRVAACLVHRADGRFLDRDVVPGG